MNTHGTALSSSSAANHLDKIARFAFESSSDGFFLFNDQNTIVEVNSSLCSLLGISEDQLLQTSLEDLIPGEDLSLLFKKAKQFKICNEKMGQVVLQNNDHLPGLELRLYALEDNLSIGLAKTLARESQEAQQLIHSEEFFRLLAESSLTGIYLIQDGKTHYVNQAFADMFGYTTQEAVEELSIVDFIHPTDRDLVLENIRRRMDGDEPYMRYSFKGQHKDGSPLFIEVHGSRTTFRGRPAVIGTLIDLTKARKTEESLEVSKVILDQAPVGIVMVDDDANIIDVNMQICNSLDYSRSELCSMTVFDIDPSFNEKRWYDHLSSIGTKKTANFETIHKRKNGETFPVEVFVYIYSHDEKDYRVAFIHDISEFKQVQQHQKQLEEQFIQVQKLEAVGRLAGGIAHDLNNLLTPILGYTGLLQNDHSISGHAQKKIAHINKAAKGSRGLIKQLLAFSRKQVLEYRALSLNTIIDDFEPLIRRTVRENIHIKIIQSAGLKPAMLDKGQIEQVLMNLIVNSADAMPDGGTLTIETKMTDLDTSYAEMHTEVVPGRYAMMSISDTGHGMDKETSSKIFEPFFTTKAEFGTGLGLATVYGIVKQHKGSIWVYTEPGQGTTFKVYFPIADYEQVQSDKSRPQTVSQERCTESILLVEDNNAVRQAVYDILTEQGYTVVAVAFGLEALEEISAGFVPDMILTDVIMPDMDGKELVTRAMVKLPNCKTLYMSGYTDNVIAQHGVLDDGVSFIQKPFSTGAILKKVRQVLQGA